MRAASDFVAGIREAFTLRHAEKAAEAQGEQQRAEVRAFVESARIRQAAAGKLSNPVGAATLLREALELTVAADRVAAGAPPNTRLDPHDVMPGIVRDYLAAESPRFVDALPFAQAEALRDALDAEVRKRLGSIDVRSVLSLRVVRYARLAALVIAIAFIGARVVRSHWLPHNVAQGKRVITSELRESTAAGVVDGRTRGTYGVATTESAHPFVTVDLEKEYGITRIRIFNRGDGWFDDSLPLVLEISADARSFHEIARRTEHFDVWTIDPSPGTRARYVRVTKPGRGFIALNEIEVYSRE